MAQLAASPVNCTTALGTALYQADRQVIYRRTDRMFAVLMAVQWGFGILAALLISPRAWAGMTNHVHPHLWAALLLGGLVSGPPILLAVFCPGQAITRYVISVTQMFTSALLIHLMGGRI